MVIGFFGHLSEPFLHAWHEKTWLALFFAVATAALVIGHFGRSETNRLGRILAQLGEMITSAGEGVQRLPDRVESILDPEIEESTSLRRQREVKSNRRTSVLLAIGVISFMTFFLGIFVYGAINPPVPREPEVAKLTPPSPPPASLPFEMRWQAPNEQSGIGGGEPPVPVPLPKPRPKNLAPAHHRGAWEFPRY
jgi:hypothetical protein